MKWVRWLRLAGILVALLVFYFLVPLSGDPLDGLPARVGAAGVVLVLLGLGVYRQLRLSLSHAARRVDGLVVTIVVVIVVFALLFAELETRSLGQFEGMHTRLDALYFVVTTMLTIGYGDIHATGQAARALVLIQMAFDAVFVAAAAALLNERVRANAAARSSRSAT